ncbi:MAG: hypothetical protein OEX12_10855 [Gammaproteobacteria bacterium]|nr:hypothetical protein [Gammaproteobacteria bacterium]
MITKFKTYGLIALSILLAIATAGMYRSKAAHAETRRKQAQQQIDTVNRAIDAQQDAAKQGRKELSDATKKAARGDFSAMDNHF